MAIKTDANKMHRSNKTENQQGESGRARPKHRCKQTRTATECAKQGGWDGALRFLLFGAMAGACVWPRAAGGASPEETSLSARIDRLPYKLACVRARLSVEYKKGGATLARTTEGPTLAPGRTASLL